MAKRYASMKKQICENLSLTMWHDKTHVHAKLENSLEMLAVEVDTEINVTTMISRAYHIKEAILLSTRRLLDKAYFAKMLDMDPSKLEAPAYHPIIKKGETDTYLDDLEDTIE